MFHCFRNINSSEIEKKKVFLDWIYNANILTLLMYLDVILCLKVIFTILQVEWIEPFKEGMIQSKSDVGFTSDGSC